MGDYNARTLWRCAQELRAANVQDLLATVIKTTTETVRVRPGQSLPEVLLKSNAAGSVASTGPAVAHDPMPERWTKSKNDAYPSEARAMDSSHAEAPGDTSCSTNLAHATAETVSTPVRAYTVTLLNPTVSPD